MNLRNNNNHFDLITNLFCIIDDFSKIVKVKKIWKVVWRKASLWASEVITMMIFWKLLWYKDKKSIFYHFVNYYWDSFKMPSYKTFVILSNKYASEWLKILSILMNINSRNVKQSLYFIDSSKIAVCWNKRIFKHKVAKWFAQRWMSSMWWFFGFKLHIITDVSWNILRVKVTPWNVDDRNPVLWLVEKLNWILVWDAGYLSKDLQNKLKEKGIDLVTWVKKNMNKLMTKWQHSLLKLREIVETAFSVLKWSDDLVSSLARSIDWHFSRIIYALLTYTISRKNKEYSLAIC